MTCRLLVPNKETYFYSFMSKERCYLCHSFQRNGPSIWHVGRMRFVSHETNLVFLVGGGGGHLVYHILLSILPSPVRSPDMTEILFTGILSLNLINQFK